MGEHTEANAGELNPFIIDDLEIGRDEVVTGVRWSCATEQVADTLAELREKDIAAGRKPDDVEPELVCQTALEQAAKRSILDEMYRSFRHFDPETGENISRAAWEQIVQRAAQNEGSTGLPVRDDNNQPTDEFHALTCALAVDAGFRAGIEDPQMDAAPGFSPEDAKALLPEALAERSDMHRLDCLIIGAKLAEAAREEITTAAATQVPDARPTNPDDPAPIVSR